MLVSNDFARHELFSEVEDRTDEVSAVAAAALHGLLDAPGAPPRKGDPLPPLWHWLTFLPNAAQRELGDDGHPMAGSFMPADRPPRRMFAGGRLAFERVATVGAPLHRVSRATSMTEKPGRTGPLLFVEITHELTTVDGLAVIDVHDVVYRNAEASPVAASPAAGDPIFDDEWEWSYQLDPTPALLFRYSALTYNAHRIHYDRPYASDVEGYPNLVVHGPLQAMALADLCRRHVPEQRVTSFEFRAQRPAFAAAPLVLRGRRVDAGGVELQALTNERVVSMTARAQLES